MEMKSLTREFSTDLTDCCWNYSVSESEQADLAVVHEDTEGENVAANEHMKPLLL